MILVTKILLLFGFFVIVTLVQIGCTRKLSAPIKLKKKLFSPANKAMSKQVQQLKTFLQQNSEYNNSVAFLIDMSVPSGRNRFVVYDIQTDSVLDKGLVAHGSGSEKRKNGHLTFSNTLNSLCTSLGKYAIGNSYQGDFGKAYKLYGLDSTNNNAFNRDIVLHKYDRMPYNEQPDDICLSYGCPMVHPAFFTRLESMIDASEKPILMVIYYGTTS